MTPERKTDIQAAIIRARAGFGVDASIPYQSMGLIGLCEMRRDIPREEFLSVLKSMDGVVLDFDVFPAEARIPTSFFL